MRRIAAAALGPDARDDRLGIVAGGFAETMHVDEAAHVGEKAIEDGCNRNFGAMEFV